MHPESASPARALTCRTFAFKRRRDAVSECRDAPAVEASASWNGSILDAPACRLVASLPGAISASGQTWAPGLVETMTLEALPPVTLTALPYSPSAFAYHRRRTHAVMV